MGKQLALLLASTLVALYIGEAFLHYFYVLPKPIANYYPLSAAKSGATINIDQLEFDTEHKYNTSGFRDEEIRFEKPAGEKRILFLGDSATEGFGVAVEDRFSNLLIEKLGGDYRGINAGQLATNPDTYFDNLITFGLALKPDIVVMGVFLGNDFQGGVSYKIPETYKVVREIKADKTSPLQEFLTLRYFRELIMQTKNKKAVLLQKSVKGNFWDIYFNEKMTKKFYLTATETDEARFDGIVSQFNQDLLPHYYEGRVIPTLLIEGVKDKLPEQKGKGYMYAEADYANTLLFIEETDRLLKDEGVDLVVVLMPDVNQVHKEEFQEMLKKDFKFNEIPSRLIQLEEMRERLVGDLGKAGVNFIDTTEALSSSDTLTYFLYDQHPNKYAHEIISQEIAKVLSISHSGLSRILP